jgi:hypothetical protein
MRKLIVSNAMSLDGYYEGPGKNAMALFDYRWPTQRMRASMLITPNGCVRLIRCCWDEFHLMIGPIVLGAGTPVFDEQPAGTLRLIDRRMWHGSGNVLLRYEVRRQET